MHVTNLEGPATAARADMRLEGCDRLASCYGAQGLGGSAVRRPEDLGLLPFQSRLVDGTAVEVDVFKKRWLLVILGGPSLLSWLALFLMVSCFSEHEAGWALLNYEIRDGRSWPFETELSLEEFRAYFLSHAAFVVRTVSETGVPSSGGQVLGAFYIKPNYPSRCAHICNGGFITEHEHRGRGVGTIMAQAFLALARDLGYKASFFNLVFATNDASIRLWTKLGFRRLATIPKAARLKGEKELVDAYMYYYDLTQYKGSGPSSDGVVYSSSSRRRYINGAALCVGLPVAVGALIAAIVLRAQRRR